MGCQRFLALRRSFFGDKLTDMEDKTSVKKRVMPRGGRPVGTLKTESSDLVARLRAASGPPPLTQEDFAREIGCGSSTIRRYELQNLLPTSGAIRDAIFRLAEKYGVTP